MIGLGRTERHFLANWWWTVDRWLLLGILSLMGLGFIMSFAASPAIAQKLEINTYHFAYRQIAFLSLSLVVMIICSLFDPQHLRRWVMAAGVLALGGVVMSLVVGLEIKGSTRWLHVMGFSIQPSEFLKPCFVVAIAWCFALQNTRFNVPGRLLADIGQMILLACVWGGMFFLAGGSYAVIALLAFIGIATALVLYHSFAHVRGRVDRFLDPSSGDTFQTDKALEAFQNGGLIGTGPGDGRIKHALPDAHTDYVFAVAAEEFGLLVGLLIIGIFALIIIRALLRLYESKDHWTQLAGSGLIMLFGLQTIINISVNLNLMPPKGMTLPFISYGGSSLLALALTMGMLLSLTRRGTQMKRILPEPPAPVSIDGAACAVVSGRAI
jgi:cell division protein FtsW